MINRGGPSLTVRIADETGTGSADIAAAFATVRGAYGLIALNTEIDMLDGKITGALQLGRAEHWLIRSIPAAGYSSRKKTAAAPAWTSPDYRLP